MLTVTYLGKFRHNGWEEFSYLSGTIQFNERVNWKKIEPNRRCHSIFQLKKLSKNVAVTVVRDVTQLSSQLRRIIQHKLNFWTNRGWSLFVGWDNSRKEKQSGCLNFTNHSFVRKFIVEPNLPLAIKAKKAASNFGK